MSKQVVNVVHTNKHTLKEKATMLAKRARGKRRKHVPPELLYKLAQTMLPIESIAIIAGCEPSLIYHRYADIVHQARESRKDKLAANMWKAADGGSERMQIWLSKQHLGYKDTYVEGQGSVNVQINIRDIP